jgi:hypothetical protein
LVWEKIAFLNYYFWGGCFLQKILSIFRFSMCNLISYLSMTFFAEREIGWKSSEEGVRTGVKGGELVVYEMKEG